MFGQALFLLTVTWNTSQTYFGINQYSEQGNMGKEKSQILLIFYSSLFFIVFFLKGSNESIVTYLT